MLQNASVLVACFAGLPEHASLSRLSLESQNQKGWKLVEDRIDLMRLVTRTRPQAVLLPSIDVAGLPHTAIIERLRQDAPDVAVVVLVREGTTALGLTDALRAGADIISWQSAEHLASLVNSLLGTRDLMIPPSEVIKALCEGFSPKACASLLLYCVEHAPMRLNVDDIASDLGVSRRSLSRRLLQSHWPAPLELIEWARLLRASLSQWMGRSGSQSLVRASGFASTAALRRSADRLLGSGELSGRVLTPLYVTTMLRRRIEAESAGLLTYGLNA